MSIEKVWINGNMVPYEKACIPVFDRGFLYGDSVFETMRSYAGVIFRLDEHLERLLRSLKSLGINAPYSKKQMAGEACRCLKMNRLKGASIRLSVTRGRTEPGIDCDGPCRANTVMIARRFEGYPEWMSRSGIKCRISDIRQNEYSPVSGMKTGNFLNYVLARSDAKKNGADEAILLNTKGYVTEAAVSNIFIVRKETLLTPSVGSGIIPGITRAVIISIAKRLKIKTEERSVHPKELTSADELFLTNSLAEVIPVVKIDSRVIGKGKPGDITKLLRISYQKQVISETLKQL